MMPVAGDQIVVSENQSIYFLETSTETDGELLRVRVRYPPQSAQPPAHFHPNQREHFEVVSGHFRVMNQGEVTTYGPGNSFQIPTGTVHWMHNVASSRGELLWETRPALNTELFFWAFWTLDRQANGDGSRPNLFQIAVLLPEFYEEFRLARPPFFVQRILFGLLSPLGKVLGYPGSRTIAGI
jgi:quercetin dioxygenase-like cupin family protein